jgi:hypothetical protein
MNHAVAVSKLILRCASYGESDAVGGSHLAQYGRGRVGLRH